MGFIDNILKKVVLQETIVEEKTRLSEAVWKIRLKGDSISKVDFIPGYFLRVGAGLNDEDLSLKEKIRSYSVWNINKPEGYLDLAVATHSGGIGAKWATDCKPGDKVYHKWKKGNFLVDDSADSYLMIGDLSALSHLYMINRNLAKDRKVESILYSQNKGELFPEIDGTTPFDFYEMPSNPYQDIISKVKEIVPQMKGKKMAYIGGDSRICVAVSKYLRKELHWETKQLKIKPFWNPDKRGLE
ncbi:siderophore-interacting protein [Kriegella aquimaris]|uniref:Oxidoreductase FAD-binding domain-containing protein n=1 Tax=Kriegella aquimaris TaxID=192904 RepID=A0A1G9JBK5_9FLAO|nr:SIP domain-containing protein [Kriegella aquimaris]SDL34798.1 Oxidoreductase FAD-binding domain-containing protein [Kriegella aquimaris]